MADRAILIDQLRRLCQVSGGEARKGEEVQRELHLDERAAGAGDAELARGEVLPGVEVPQLERDESSGSIPDQPQPVADVIDIHLEAADGLQRAGHLRRGGGISSREPDRERIEHEVNRPWRVRTGGCIAGRLGRLAHVVVAFEPVRPDRRAE